MMELKTSFKGSKTEHGLTQHPLQLWKEMIGVNDFLSREGNHKHSLLKKSPDRGPLKKPAKVKSSLKEWAGDGAQVDISAAIYPCFAIGLTAFWSITSDPIILATSAPSLLDPQALQLLDPELIREALNPGIEKVVFDPLNLMDNSEASAEVDKSAYSDFESNLRQKKYGPAAAIFLGAALTMMILLKSSGTAN